MKIRKLQIKPEDRPLEKVESFNLKSGEQILPFTLFLGESREKVELIQPANFEVKTFNFSLHFICK